MKYKNIKCSYCRAKGSVIPLGRVFGTYGKKQFKCSACGHTWQYGN